MFPQKETHFVICAAVILPSDTCNPLLAPTMQSAAMQVANAAGAAVKTIVPKTKSTVAAIWTFLSRNLRYNYFRMHLLFFTTMSLLGGLFIYLLERSNSHPLCFVDALFHSVSAVTDTGLLSADLPRFCVGTHVVMILLVQIGGSVGFTLVPMLLRRYFYRELYLRLRQKQKDSKQPVTLDVEENVEYQALGLLVWINGLYVVLVQLAGTLLLGFYFQFNDDAHEAMKDNRTK